VGVVFGRRETEMEVEKYCMVLAEMRKKGVNSDLKIGHVRP
jgi:hypothetical protein